MVDRAKVQRTDQREVNDTQSALQKLTDQLNSSPLALNQLPFTFVSPSIIAWVGAGNALVQPVMVVTEKSTLIKVVWVSTIALGADGTNYRTFTLDLYRAATKVSSLASGSTQVSGITALVSYPLTLATQSSDLALQTDDVIILTLDGGGTKPALNNGALTLYFKKSN